MENAKQKHRVEKYRKKEVKIKDRRKLIVNYLLDGSFAHTYITVLVF